MGEKLINVILLQEVFLPLYTLGVLIIVRIMIPNPNYPAMTSPRTEHNIFEKLRPHTNKTIAVVPNTTETLVSIFSLTIRQRAEMSRW